MSERQRYVKRPDQKVHAVQLDLDTDGFTYRKWGAEQRCKPGDWLVSNPDPDTPGKGDTYTVDRETFARTYRHVGDGAYLKTTPIWAERADAAGDVKTKEGSTHYEPGDYLVFNQEDGGDPYATPKAAFERMYERAD
jgi:hypothetical protein